MELKQIRTRMGLNQSEVAKRLNMHSQTYNRYENGQMDPSTSTLIKLADFFNVSVDEILGRETNTVNLNFYDDTRKRLFKEIMNASDEMVSRLEAVYEGLKQADKERIEIIRRMRGDDNGTKNN